MRIHWSSRTYARERTDGSGHALQSVGARRENQSEVNLGEEEEESGVVGGGS